MAEQLVNLPINSISKNPYQPRLNFSEQELEELAQSIRENGLIQPIIVRKSPLAGYELIAGERRFRACQLAGLTHIQAIVKELTDEESMKQAIIENIQRYDLNPIEEALSYQQLIDKLGITHDEIATTLGKSRPYVSNSLRLLNLTENAKKALIANRISSGHARLLLSLPKQDQNDWLEAIIAKDWTVRQLERQLKTRPVKPTKKSDRFIKEQEMLLKQQLGLNCQFTLNKTGKGHLKIEFSSFDDIDRFINRLTITVDK